MMRSMPEAVASRDLNLFRVYLEENLSEGHLKGYECALLIHIIQFGKREHLEILIEKDWDVNMSLGRSGAASLDDGWTGDDATALHWAVALNKLKHIKLLLAAGADVNARDADNATPLHAPFLYGDVDILQVLIEHGADVNAKNNDGETALLQWAEEGRSDGVRYLMEQGADIHEKRADGTSILWFVANRSDTELAEELLGRGATLDFWSAVMLGKVEAVRAFLQASPELLESTDTRGWTPLYNAVAQKQWAMVEFLLRSGALPDHAEDKRYPLLQAVLANQLEIVKLLVYAGANLHAPVPTHFLFQRHLVFPAYCDAKSLQPPFTLLSVAEQQGFGEIAAFLRLAGAK